jgi:hypothetical protein
MTMAKLATKTYNIGEYANYGTWRIDVYSDKIIATGLTYKTDHVQDERIFPLGSGSVSAYGLSDRVFDQLRDFEIYMSDNSTSYYASKMREFVEGVLIKKGIIKQARW